MSGTLNKVMLIGHLGDEVKMHYFEGGNCIGRFPVATNETYTNKQTGEKVSNTEWHPGLETPLCDRPSTAPLHPYQGGCDPSSEKPQL